ncbi:MAG TPA: DNA internalization-related competence protein ComEC/Rec2 [Longimicrobiales bacterium]
MPLIARIAMVFASGALAGAYLSDLSSLLLPLCAAGIAVVLLAREREAGMLVLVSVSALVLGAVDHNRKQATCHRFADGQLIRVAGLLETRPSDAQRTVQLRTGASGACRTVRVRLPDDAAQLAVGDAIVAAGTWLVQRISIDERPAADGLLLATVVGPAPHVKPSLLLRERGRVQQRIRALFPTGYPLAEALLIAQREALNTEVRESFAAAGLTHLLAISGTHVALVAAALLLIARLLRCSQLLASIISIGGSAAYVLFLGAPFAAVRALIQMAMILLSRRLQRPAHPLGLLATAAIIICVIDPSAPADAGFQLSFAGIVGMILWRRPLIDAMPESWPVKLRDAIATTLSATLITTPIAAFQFGIVSVVAIIANLLAGPVVSLAVPTAAAAVALSYVSMDAARFIAGGAELTLLWLFHIARLCAAAPFGHFYAASRDVVLCTVAALLAGRALQGSYRSSRTGRVATAVLAGLVPLTGAPVLSLTDRTLQIHMIDVGQGDAFAIRSPRGRWLLVDAGPRSERFDAGKARAVPFLLRHQAARVEVAILSHPHLDHFGGLAAIAGRIRIGAVVDPAMPVASPDYDSLLAAMGRMHRPWLAARTGNILEMDGLRLEFLAPDSVLLDPSADANDYSTAFRLSYGSFSGLFLGDMYVAEEEQLVARFGRRLDVDLLKVAHHGSHSSSSPELLEAATPRIALISAGRRNRYGHPDRGTLVKLGAVGARTFRTDQDGSVSIVVRADGKIDVRTRQ